MFLEGHREILAEVVATRLPPRFFASGWLGGKRSKDVNPLAAIQRGMEYPDMPCGAVQLEGVRAVMRRPALCSTASMVKLFRTKHQYSEQYQSFHGSLVHLHAMSPVAGAKAGQVTRTIVSHALMIATLFRKSAHEGDEDCPFWVGAMLHTLTDSYSDAHTIRLPGVALVRAAPPPRSQDKVMRHAALLYDIAGRTLDQPLGRAELAEAIDRSSGIDRARSGARRQHRLYLLYVLHRQTDRDVRIALPSVDERLLKPASRTPGGHAPTVPRTHDIRAYSYYPTQNTGYHAIRDRLRLVRDRPAMWSRMLDECAELVRIFKEDGLRRPLDGRRETARFLTRLLDFLLAGPFRLAPGAEGRTPMNYS
jgi:hypothetical protein